MRRAGFRQGRATRAIVVVGLGVFVLGVYVLVVLGGGALTGRTDSPSPILSVLATTVVALAFAPAERVLERAAARHRATPYDVLARFTDSAGDDDAAADLPARMSRLLAQGTGAQWAQVWLHMGDRVTLAGRWPLDARDDKAAPVPGSFGAPAGRTGGLRTCPVRYGDEELGALRLQERPGVPLTVVEERLFTDLASQAGLVLRLAALRATLEDRRRELQARTLELESSRARVIEAQDAERSRLERDIHDSAQQHLVALAMSLRLAQTVATRAPHRARGVLAEQADAAQLAIDTLSALSRGIFPQMLSEQGLVAALRSGVSASPIPVFVEAEDLGRAPPLLEAALYFCCMEAVQNAAKHSEATRVTVRLHEATGDWRLDVIDDGAGFDEQAALLRQSGAGLLNMRDRLDAVGGRVRITSAAGSGTMVSAFGPVTEQGGGR
jgi:signal transduction histidine kinase